MSQAKASVKIIQRPDLGDGGVRIEVGCQDSTTGLTYVPGPLQLTVPMLVTQATFAHEERCAIGCDTSGAHAQGDQAIRAQTERLHGEMQQRRGRQYAREARN